VTGSGSEAGSQLRLEAVSVDLHPNGSPLRIVDNLSLAIRRGETLGLVGESGSGKSTVANAILRLLPPRTTSRVSGSIMLDETELLALPESEMRKVRGNRIAMIPQDPMSSLNPLITIGAQIAEVLKAHGRGRGRSRQAIRAEIIALLGRVRIDAPATRIDQYPHELSGGMRQRVVGAIAMACSPEFLLADEPTTALDVTVQAQYLDMLMELQRENGLGMLFITHDLGVIAHVSTRVAVMYAGRIVESGATAAIFAEPRHWYTRALLDSLPGTVRTQSRLASITGSPLRPGTAISGCAFAPRCPAARDACRQSEPELEPGAAGATGLRSGDIPHRVRCHFPVDVDRFATK
jgi:oligopeptide/dipeptide ABC transporter ATP-binding protein